MPIRHLLEAHHAEVTPNRSYVRRRNIPVDSVIKRNLVYYTNKGRQQDRRNRDLAFILDSNRLNVALSRAQALAIVVGDPNIAATPAANVKGLRLINTFCRLLHTTESRQKHASNGNNNT